MIPLFPTWRWFGPDDPIPLAHIAQTGARGIVTALHGVPAPWPEEAIRARKAEIEAAGLVWAVVESIPVTDPIKRGGPGRDAEVAGWAETLRNLAAAGIDTVCYNFMPVLDWTRTELTWRMPTGALALRFDPADLAAWDAHGLGRTEGDDATRRRWREIGPDAQAALDHAILSGLPGSDRGYGHDEFRAALEAYDGLGADDLRANLAAFLRDVVPVAEAAGIRLGIHPDDPPMPLFGLPRVVSNGDDLQAVLDAAPSRANGLTFCTGSLGARADNDLPALAARFAGRIAFAHLRNVRREPGGAFHEADHLGGSTDMPAVLRPLMAEAARRDAPLPFRPDHGHAIGPDAERRFNPGYTFAGRLRGLSELMGAQTVLASL